MRHRYKVFHTPLTHPCCAVTLRQSHRVHSSRCASDPHTEVFVFITHDQQRSYESLRVKLSRQLAVFPEPRRTHVPPKMMQTLKSSSCDQKHLSLACTPWSE